MTGEDVAAPGAHAAVDRGDIHQLANVGGEDTVTIHIYSPPLGLLNVFSTETAGSEPLRLWYTLQDDLG
jgi:predicted metal-dependent enzyme (double-stranded beta helix superfamily)